MNKQFPLFLFAIVVVLSCNRCKEECDDATNPECPNYVAPVVINPCEDAEETSADFEMYQHLSPGLTIDTLIEFYNYCLTNRDITLRASQDNANYHWIIGADDYYTQEVTFEVGSQFEDVEIPLTLIVTRAPDSLCNNNDNGVDTVTKTIVARYYCNSSIYGKYYGTWENEEVDSFVVEFTYEADGSSFCGIFNLVGVQPLEPDTCINGNTRRVDNYLEFDGFAGDCYMPIGTAQLDSALQNITIDYSILVNITQNEPRIQHVFKGHKIN